MDDGRFSKAANSQMSRGPDHTFDYQEVGFRLSYKVLSFSRPNKLNISNGEFFSEDGGLLIALNGEIYNWKALSKEYFGAEDRFRSDTEFLVNFVRAKGPREAIRRIRGMYAFVVFDVASKTLSYFRDLSGEKFLYRYENEYYVVLSSDIRSIVDYTKTSRVDKEIIKNYMYTRHLLTLEKTCYNNISLVEKGSANALNIKTFSESTIFRGYLHDLVDENLYREYAKLRESEIQLIFQDILSKVSADFLQDRNSVTCVVSGGVDSTLAAAAMRASNASGGIRGVGISFSGKEETLTDFLDMKRSWREWVSSLSVDRTSFQDALVKSYEIARTPLPTHNFPSQYILAGAVRKMGSSILVSGDGADEAFGGYTAYRQLDFGAEHPDYCPSPYSGVAGTELIELGRNENADLKRLSDGWRKSLDTYHFLEREERMLAATMLCDLAYQVESVGLLNADLMNLSNSVEGRSFYMHHEILKFALNLPVRARINPKSSDEDGLKIILRREFTRRTGLAPFPKVGYSGFPNEAAETLLEDSDYRFTSDLLSKPIKSMYRDLSTASKWKVNNLELFSRVL